MGLLECERGTDDGSELSSFASGDSEECTKVNRPKKEMNDKVTRNNKSKTDQLSLGRADLFEHLLARSRSYIFSKHHTSAIIGAFPKGTLYAEAMGRADHERGLGGLGLSIGVREWYNHGCTNMPSAHDDDDEGIEKTKSETAMDMDNARRPLRRCT